MPAPRPIQFQSGVDLGSLTALATSLGSGANRRREEARENSARSRDLQLLDSIQRSNDRNAAIGQARADNAALGERATRLQRAGESIKLNAQTPTGRIIRNPFTDSIQQAQGQTAGLDQQGPAGIPGTGGSGRIDLQNGGSIAIDPATGVSTTSVPRLANGSLDLDALAGQELVGPGGQFALNNGGEMTPAFAKAQSRAEQEAETQQQLTQSIADQLPPEDRGLATDLAQLPPDERVKQVVAIKKERASQRQAQQKLALDAQVQQQKFALDRAKLVGDLQNELSTLEAQDRLIASEEDDAGSAERSAKINATKQRLQAIQSLGAAPQPTGGVDSLIDQRLAALGL